MHSSILRNFSFLNLTKFVASESFRSVKTEKYLKYIRNNNKQREKGNN